MKSALIKYFPIIIVVMILFTGCKNNSKTPPTGAADPIFESNPKLKNITDQIAQSPKNAGLYFERGAILQKLKLDTLAINDYKMAATLDSTKAEYYSAVGNLLFETKDITGSVQWIQKAIEKNPTDRKAHLKIAKLFLYTKDYQSAFAEINKVLRVNPYDPEAYFLKGMLYKDTKDTAKAISNFQTSVQVAPDYRDAVIQLGLLYSAKKDPIALVYLENAFKIDSTDVFPIFARGVYYQDVKDFVKAKEEYKRCILHNRHYADAFFNMGYILMHEDSLEKAYRQYDIVTKIDAFNPTAYYNRGLCSEMMDSLKKAVSDYRTALTLDSAYQSPKDALRRLGVKN